MAEFDIAIQYRPGQTNDIADALSRRPTREAASRITEVSHSVEEGGPLMSSVLENSKSSRKEYFFRASVVTELTSVVPSTNLVLFLGAKRGKVDE